MPPAKKKPKKSAPGKATPKPKAKRVSKKLTPIKLRKSKPAQNTLGQITLSVEAFDAWQGKFGPDFEGEPKLYLGVAIDQKKAPLWWPGEDAWAIVLHTDGQLSGFSLWTKPGTPPADDDNKLTPTTFPLLLIDLIDQWVKDYSEQRWKFVMILADDARAVTMPVLLYP